MPRPVVGAKRFPDQRSSDSKSDPKPESPAFPSPSKGDSRIFEPPSSRPAAKVCIYFQRYFIYICFCSFYHFIIEFLYKFFLNITNIASSFSLLFLIFSSHFLYFLFFCFFFLSIDCSKVSTNATGGQSCARVCKWGRISKLF